MAHQLEERYLLIIYTQAKLAGFDFAPDCERYMRQTITAGVNRIITERAENDSTKLALAEDNLRLFLSEMIAEAKRKGYSVLREDTYYKARGLCPLWPFC